MAYDHNFREKKNAQKAAEQTFEPKSKRDERILIQKSSQKTWFAVIAITLLMVLAYSVISHFGTNGPKSAEKTEQAMQAFLNDSSPEETSVVVESSDTQPAESATEFVNEVWGKEASLAPDAKISNGVRQYESIPLPQGALEKPKITFYDEMKTLEVPMDDPEKFPIMLEVPEYIVAGSFFNEQSAKRELKRLADHGQELMMIESEGKNGRLVYVLKTQPYENRKELGARKNELRKLGARVRSYKLRD